MSCSYPPAPGTRNQGCKIPELSTLKALDFLNQELCSGHHTDAALPGLTSWIEPHRECLRCSPLGVFWTVSAASPTPH